MKKISVIVPIYNIEQYLERMLNSLLNQSFSNLEIILIDDGSTDSSCKICDEYKEKDNRIKVIHQKNSGVSCARNKGLSIATGDYIGFVDSDDVIDKDMFKRLYDNIKKYDCEISICGFVTFNNIPSFEYSDKIIIFDKEKALKDIISDGDITGFLWNKLFKKDLFNGIEFPNGKIYEDMYVMPKLIEKANKICFDNSKLYGYFIRSNSYVNTYNEKKNVNYLTFSDECYNYLKKYDYLKDDLEKYRLFYIYSAFLQGAKSKCKNIFKDEYMSNYYDVYRKNFKIDNSYSFKRKVLSLVLYINKNLFYFIIDKII